MAKSLVSAALTVLLSAALAAPALAQDKKAEKGEKGEKSDKAQKTEKAKAEKVAGDIGLLDTERNYMIVVTKEGKLVTVEFNQKTKITELQSKPAKMADIGLGSSASIEYVKKGEKNQLSKIEFLPAKGGD
jgi:hypothetical protein